MDSLSTQTPAAYTTPKLIIGFTGLAGSGKDTCAHMASKHRLASSHAFVRPLKSAMRELFGLSEAQLYGNQKEVVDPRWGKTPRELLQWFGTDVVRNQFDQDFFLKRMKSDLDSALDVALVTDVRFDNEAELIRGLGGKIVHIHRPSNERRSDHVSESGVAKHLVDVVIVNDGTLEELEMKVRELIH